MILMTKSQADELMAVLFTDTISLSEHARLVNLLHKAIEMGIVVSTALTLCDLEACRATWHALQAPCSVCEPGCDCHDEEEIMTSIGYVTVFQYGAVVSHERTLAKF